VLTLHIPPLRERMTDVFALGTHFAEITAHKFGLPTPELSKESQQQLKAYDWPGNVRELKHLIERAVLLSQGKGITARSLGLEASQYGPVKNNVASSAITLDKAEAQMILEALKKTRGNVSEAARKLGITRMALRYRIQKHNIQIN